MTRVIPREDLPPISRGLEENPTSKATGPTIEQLADVARAQRDSEDAELEIAEKRQAQEETDTMVPCPCCATCSICHGLNMVRPEVAKELELAREKR